jgi:hypothetical protein
MPFALHGGIIDISEQLAANPDWAKVERPIASITTLDAVGVLAAASP